MLVLGLYDEKVLYSCNDAISQYFIYCLEIPQKHHI